MAEDERKICPLLSIAEDIFGNCEKEKCAWWIEREGKCAITCIARKLLGGARSK